MATQQQIKIQNDLFGIGYSNKDKINKDQFLQGAFQVAQQSNNAISASDIITIADTIYGKSGSGSETITIKTDLSTYRIPAPKTYEEIQALEAGLKRASSNNPTGVENGFGIDQTQLNVEQNKALGFGKRTLESGKIIDNFDEGISKQTGLKSFGFASDSFSAGRPLLNQFVGEDFQRFDQARRNFINAVLRRESGAAIADSEFENANKQYFPVPGDTEATIAQKKSNRELVTSNLLGEAGVSQNQISFDPDILPDEQSNTQSKGQPLTAEERSFESALQASIASPSEELSQQIFRIAEQRGYDINTGRKKVDNTVSQTTETPVQQQAERPSNKSEEELQGFTDKFVGGLASFLKIDVIGEAIGDTIVSNIAARRFDDAQDELEKIDISTEEGKAAYKQITRDIESARRIAETVDEKTFLEIFGAGLTTASAGAGGLVLNTGRSILGRAAGKAAEVVGTGAAIGAAESAAEAQDISDGAKSGGIINTILSGLGPVGRGLGKAKDKLIGKSTREEAIGKVIQGKTDDVNPAGRAFDSIDTEGVKTFTDLSDRFNDSISTLSRAVDQSLDNTKRTKLGDLSIVQVTESGTATSPVNHVEDALEHLKEFYVKSNANAQVADMEDLIKKATDEGLTAKEINDISRDYGTTFGNKAFSKVSGDPLTSVSAQNFENTRKGIKSVARSGIGGEEAKRLDKLISDQISTKNLIDKNVESVNKLSQKFESKAVGAVTVRFLSQASNLISLGGTNQLLQLVQTSNVGNKTLNWKGIEDALSKNIKIIEKSSSIEDTKKLEEYLGSKEVRDHIKNMVNLGLLSSDDE